MSEITPYESITKTLETFDPEHKGLLIGTSAIHFALASRGCDTDAIPLRDVDLLTCSEDMSQIREDLPRDLYENAKWLSDTRYKVEPSEKAKKLGVCILDVTSDTNEYDNPMIRTKFGGRVYANTEKYGIERSTKEHEGVKYLDLPFTFWWKSLIGRDTDVSTIESALKIMIESGQFYANEFMSAKHAIRMGSGGYDLRREFIYSSDPIVRAEQELTHAPVLED